MAIGIEQAELQNVTAVLGHWALRWAEPFMHTFGYRNNYVFGAVTVTQMVYASLRMEPLAESYGMHAAGVYYCENKGWRGTLTQTQTDT